MLISLDTVWWGLTISWIQIQICHFGMFPQVCWFLAPCYLERQKWWPLGPWGHQGCSQRRLRRGQASLDWLPAAVAGRWSHTGQTGSACLPDPRLNWGCSAPYSGHTPAEGHMWWPNPRPGVWQGAQVWGWKGYPWSIWSWAPGCSLPRINGIWCYRSAFKVGKTKFVPKRVNAG